MRSSYYLRAARTALEAAAMLVGFAAYMGWQAYRGKLRFADWYTAAYGEVRDVLRDSLMAEEGIPTHDVSDTTP